MSNNNLKARLREQGIILPTAPAPAGAYVQHCRTGNLLYIAGQLPLREGALAYMGKVGTDISLEEGTAAARLCALNILAQAKTALGHLDKVKRVVRLNGFVNCTPDFADHPKVINGASDLMVEVFGETGRHTRMAVGVGSLPLNAAVEVDAVIEVG